MPWKYGHLNDSWWAHDADDGQLQQVDGEDQNHMEYVSVGLDTFNEAVAEYCGMFGNDTDSRDDEETNNENNDNSESESASDSGGDMRPASTAALTSWRVSILTLEYSSFHQTRSYAPLYTTRLR